MKTEEKTAYGPHAIRSRTTSRCRKKFSRFQAALQQDYDRQMQTLEEDAARRKYAGFIENTG